MQNRQPDIRAYRNPNRFLRDFIEARKKENPLLSTRSFAQRMGFKNHSLLSLIINEVRPIRPRHLPKILKATGFTKDEAEYFEALVLFENSSSELEKKIYEDKIREISPNYEVLFLDVELFRLISNWLHTALLEMTELKDFCADPQWIATRLGGRVYPSEVEAAIKRLLHLGLLEEKRGKLRKTHQHLTTPKTNGSRAIREYHKAVIDLAKEAVDEQTPAERVLNSFSFTLAKEKFPLAQKCIEKFREELLLLLEESPGDETYQCNVQLFRLTKEKKMEDRK